jgi:tRNA1(Val) A37 N6-methylase TrmN6
VTAEDLRRDAYLGGRLHLWQPVRGYRAGMDAVLLAASCPAQPGDRVLDIGCGVGTAALCLGARVPGLVLWGIEREAGMVALARRNASENGQALSVAEADATRMPDALRALSFEHVILNPPYFDRAHGSAAPGAQREAAMGEDTPLAALILAARKRLRPRGGLTLIHRAERLGAVLATLEGAGFGAIEALPLLPRAGRAARLVLVRARKGAGTPLRLLAPVVLHAAPRHARDGEDYTPQIAAVLRDAAAFPGWI